MHNEYYQAIGGYIEYTKTYFFYQEWRMRKGIEVIIDALEVL